MRYGIAIAPCAPINQVADAISCAESLGFDAAWLPDAQLLWRDVWAAMALAAVQTESISLAPGVSNTETRHPTTVASAVNTIHELAPGRVTLGVGSGAGLGQLINMPSSTRATLRHDVEMIRKLLAGGWWDFEGRQARLMDAAGPVPIVMTAGGPKMGALAGEIAEGVILSVGTDPEVISTASSWLDEGLAAAGRSRDDIEVILTSFFALTDDVERDAARFKPICCLLAKAGAGRELLEKANVPLGDLTSLPAVYPTIAHAPDWDEAVRLASTVISDEAAMVFADRFGLFGTIDQIAEKIARVEQAGVDQLFIRPMEPYALPYEAMEAMGQAVLRRTARPAAEGAD